MNKQSESLLRLSFIFTENSFLVDMPGAEVAEDDRELKKRFLSEKYDTLFQLGFEDVGKGESASLAFLRKVSGVFIDAFTSMPEIEMVSENAWVKN